ncbi:MAG: Gfo/Idh/MocA family oxidoreductase [Planctomycetaceae bacterium]|nr:Gfo/Idh/MocA family oxidoreductase [Planctomycetaceae bacterium]
MQNQATRREFLKVAGVTGAGFWHTAGQQRQARADANSRIAFGGIGIGGKGHGDINNAAKFCDVVALCDTDRKRLKNAQERFPNAKSFTDYREMLDSLGDKLDAVNVSTADHTHACASLMAMRLKKHCYTQKPLTRTIYEARLMSKVARETGVCTQMGNQGSSDRALRTAAAQLRAGALGEVLEMHVWTDRPIWPQGIDPNRVKTIQEFSEKIKKEQSPEEAEKLITEKTGGIVNDLENNIDWESWIGPAKFREYFPGVYTPFVWRGWWDFGTGALGDIACHSLNMPMKGLDLSAPSEVVATTSGHDFDIFPSWSVIDYTYPANSWRPGFKFTWYDGGKRPAPELLEKYEIALDAKGGSIIIGTKGAMVGNGLVGCERIKDLDVEFAPEHPEHNDNDSRNMYEFCVAIQEGKPERCFSNFPNQAGPLTEAMLLGNLAVWTAYEPEKQGETIKWDAAGMKVTNLADIKTPNTADLIKPVYRDGYRLD